MLVGSDLYFCVKDGQTKESQIRLFRGAKMRQTLLPHVHSQLSCFLGECALGTTILSQKLGGTKNPVTKNFAGAEGFSLHGQFHQGGIAIAFRFFSLADQKPNGLFQTGRPEQENAVDIRVCGKKSTQLIGGDMWI